jgi:hypothetical protein
MVFSDIGSHTIAMLRVMKYPLDFVTIRGDMGLKIAGKCPMLDEDNQCMMFYDESEDMRPLDCIIVEVGDRDCTRHRARAGLPPIEI